jgi:hypothetical protein
MRRQALALVANERVRVVLDDEQLAVAGKVGDRSAALERERLPARVLEGRNRVQERGGQLDRVGIEAVVVHRQRDGLGLVPRGDVQRAVVGRPLDEDARAGWSSSPARSEGPGASRS